MKLYRLALTAVLWGALVTSAHAVGLAIQPSSLRLAAGPGSVATGKFLVTNVADEPAMYSVGSQALPRELIAQPQSFRLDPGSSQLVTLSYRPQGIADRRVTLDVVAKPMSVASFAVASGVHYPVELVAGIRWVNYLVRGSLVVLVSGLALAMARRPQLTEHV